MKIGPKKVVFSIFLIDFISLHCRLHSVVVRPSSHVRLLAPNRGLRHQQLRVFAADSLQDGNVRGGEGDRVRRGDQGPPTDGTGPAGRGE